MSKVQRAVLFQVLSVLLAIGVAIWIIRAYPVALYVTRAQALIGGLGWRGLLAYPLLFGACNILLLPAGTLALGSGLFFGLWRGFAINVAGNLLAAGVSMALSRRFGRGLVRRYLLTKPKWAALDEAVGREGWKIIFLSQLLPFAPSSLLNYLFGITRVPWGRALFWSCLGQVPTMFVYAYLGTFAKFGLGVIKGGTHPPALEVVSWSGGLVITIFATWGLTRLSLRLLHEAEEKSSAAVLKSNPEILPNPPVPAQPHGAEAHPAAALAEQAF